MEIKAVYINETTGSIYSVQATGGAFNSEYDYQIKEYDQKEKTWGKAYDCKALNAAKAIAKYENSKNRGQECSE